MGRGSWSDRTTVEECKTVSISWLKAHDYLCGYRSGGIQWKGSDGEVRSSIQIQVAIDDPWSGGKYVRFIYTYTSGSSGEKSDLDYRVELVTTACNYGGVRYWFICPLTINGRYCGRRVGKLYLPPGGRYFGCRHCYNLTYECQKEHDKRVDALLRDPRLLLEKLGRDAKKASVIGLKAAMKILDNPRF